MQKSKEAGFTLIEMMIVLFIIISVTGIVLVSFQSLHKKQEADHFLEEVKKDLYLAQEYSISHYEQVTFTFLPTEHLYEIQAPNRTVSVKQYPEDILVDVRTMKTIIFNKTNANISKVGNIKIVTPQGSYKLVFHPGKGRFYIEKQ